LYKEITNNELSIFKGNSVSWDIKKEKEFELLLSHYNCLMRSHIQKYQPGRFGVDFEDVLQEARIKIWKLLNNDKNIVSYTSYIKKIMDTSVIDFFRKFKREEGIYLHEKAKTISENTTGYDKNIIYAEMDLKDLVGNAVNSLIPTRRNVVRLYLLNMSIEEIASYYSWSPSKTRNLLYRGLKDLKIILKDKNIDFENQ
jgi:RNA polymerase sigma factor (sigma-70 family)